MNKLLHLLLGLLIGIPFASSAEIVKHWEVHYSLDDFSIRTDKGGRIHIAPGLKAYDIHSAYRGWWGMPALCPQEYRGPSVDNSYRYVSHTLTVADKVLVRENVALGGCGASASLNTVDDEWFNEDRSGLLPLTSVEVDVDESWMGTQVRIFLFPFVYDLDTKSLYLIPQVSLDVTFEENPDVSDVSEIEKQSLAFKALYTLGEYQEDNSLLMTLTISS